MSEIINPYWDEVRDHVRDNDWQRWSTGKTVGNFQKDGGVYEMFKRRHELTSRYAWVITAPETVAFVVEHLGSAAIDPLGGSGYWAYLLGQAGVNTFASDVAPAGSGITNEWHRDPPWTDMVQMDGVYAVQRAARERSLLLSWPPYGDPIGAQVLSAYTGDRVVYIGESKGGCCGDDDMHALLGEHWAQVAEHQPVQWWGMHDYVTVYDRKGGTS